MSPSPRSFVADLARAEIGTTFNQYRESPLRRARLAAYVALRASARILIVGEAAGYRGARVSGIPFTSERLLNGGRPGEASATLVHDVLTELGVEQEVVLWNLVPTHPHELGNPESNRRPTRDEVEAGRTFLHRLADGRRIVPIGRLAQAELGGPYVRHPSHGGAREFRAALVQLLA
jgi:uracil-DNA glycosylase